MNVVVEDKGPCEKILKVEVPYSEMKDEVTRIHQTIQSQAALPGFRAGKVPWNLLERQYSDTIESEIKNQVVQSVYQNVLEEKNLHPVKSPVVNKVEYEKGKN